MKFFARSAAFTEGNEASAPPNKVLQPTSLPPGLRPSGRAAAEPGCWAPRGTKLGQGLASAKVR